MSKRQFRSFTVKQLGKASAESWNDAMVLAEILAELRRRAPDSQVDALIRSNVRRLSTLTYRPIDQANAPRVAAEKDDQPATAVQRRSRRRILVAALFSGAAAGVATVLLLPARDPPPSEARPVGLQMSGASEPRTVIPATTPATSVAPGTPTVAIREPQPVTGEPRPRFRTSLAANETEVIRFDAERLRQRTVLYPAEAGLRLSPRLFECYASSSDPRRCETDVGHEVERAMAHPRPRGAVDPHFAPVRSPLPIAALDTRPASRDRAEGSFLGRTTEILSRASATRPAEPGGPAAAREAAPADACGAPSGRLVFVMDGSLSMGLPADLDPAVEDRLDERIRNKDEEARQQYRALLAEPGPKRISRAGDAFESAVRELPDFAELGLIAFRECRDIRTFGVFDMSRRPAAIDAIRNLVPHGRTPIAESLRRAAELLDEGPSAIVLLTDGREFCGGDPCAVAAEIKAKHKETSIHVVDLGGQARTECVAQATGGRNYSLAASDDLGGALSQAFRGALQCPAKAEAPAPARPAGSAPAAIRR